MNAGTSSRHRHGGAARTPRRRRARGFTLPEILVSLLLTGIFASGVHRFSLSALQGVRVLEATSRLQEGARIALLIMARDAREAGYALPGTAAAIPLASWDELRIARDLNRDGDTDDSNELLAYRFDAAQQRLLRQLGHAPAQPMLEELAPDGLYFVYYDALGNRLPAETPLSPAERDRIRRIDLGITLQTPHPIPGSAETLRIRRNTTVTLRND